MKPSGGFIDPAWEAIGPQPSGGAQRTYRAISAYAFAEPICWPSMRRIARDCGITERTVRRHVRQLQEAGWLRIVEKRTESPDTTGRMRHSKWQHNVYELLAPYATSDLAVRRVVREAHRRRVVRDRWLAQKQVAESGCPTNSEAVGAARFCGCPSCRPDRPSLARTPSTPARDAIRRREELYGRDLSLDEQRTLARVVRAGVLDAATGPVR